ncbi:putative DNA-binding protein [Salirhabdus sp. Marseille-P4669]|uniref:putative DNA-binding protein n=1 Tax=Salirhabdus sp. Marseille-P4669 TaxID=2042310 RepID=UPI000C7DB803|nr:putative DNA-binding protein [Salirhabdus sp. Marseille-P4669]
MIQKTTRINYLFDFYQELLTPKQRNYLEMYYLEDFSLGEIADQFEVSRQAVYDNIKRTEAMLEEYEEKLHLYEKFEKRQEMIAQLKEFAKRDKMNHTELFEIIEQFENLD